jgi:hypothetical protein
MRATTAGAGWDRRRLLVVLTLVAAAGVLLLVGFAYAVRLAWSDAASGAPTPATARPDAGAVGPASSWPVSGPSRREAIAAAPMLDVDPLDARPMAPATQAVPTISIPSATRTGAGGVASGFPHSPEGAVGQLAAITVTVLAQMSIAGTGEVYRAWAMPGGVGAPAWELTGNVRIFLAAAGQGPAKDLTTVVAVRPVAAQIKGSDGPDWTLACVLLDVEATITTRARIAYGYCERMQWAGSGWMIAPGPAPARAPSTWPGSAVAIRAGWRAWTPPSTPLSAGQD